MLCNGFLNETIVIKHDEIYCKENCEKNKNQPRFYLSGHGRNFAPCERYEVCEAFQSKEAREEFILGKDNVICNKSQCSHLNSFEFDNQIFPICLNHGLIEKISTQQQSPLLS